MCGMETSREDFPEVDVPFAQSFAPDVTIGVRTVEDPEAMTKTITAAVHSVDPEILLGFIPCTSTGVGVLLL